MLLPRTHAVVLLDERWAATPCFRHSSNAGRGGNTGAHAEEPGESARTIGGSRSLPRTLHGTDAIIILKEAHERQSPAAGDARLARAARPILTPLAARGPKRGANAFWTRAVAPRPRPGTAATTRERRRPAAPARPAGTRPARTRARCPPVGRPGTLPPSQRVRSTRRPTRPAARRATPAPTRPAARTEK